MKKIILVVVSLVFIGSLSFGAFYYYKHNQRQQNQLNQELNKQKEEIERLKQKDDEIDFDTIDPCNVLSNHYDKERCEPDQQTETIYTPAPSERRTINCYHWLPQQTTCQEE